MNWYVERLNELNRALRLVRAARQACPADQYAEWLAVTSAVDMEIEKHRRRVAEMVAPWFDGSAFQASPFSAKPGDWDRFDPALGIPASAQSEGTNGKA